MGVLRSIASALRSVLFTVRRKFASPWKDPNSKGSSGPELGAWERKVSSQSTGGGVRRPNTASTSTSFRTEEISDSQEQVKVDELKKIEPEVSLPPCQEVSFPPLATPEDATSLQIVDIAVPAISLPESDPDVSSCQEEQEPSTENTVLEEKYLNDSSPPKQPVAESDGEESDTIILSNSESGDTDSHQEIEPTNSVVKTAFGLNDSNEQSEEHPLDTLLERKDQTEDTTKNGSKEVIKPKRRPTKYQPSIRTADTTNRTRSNNAKQTEANTSRLRTLRMCLHVVLGLRNQFRMSLIPERTEDLEEEIEIIEPDGQITTWSASQDEWYCDIVPKNLGDLLVNGADWELHSEAEQLRWVLSWQKIYVLARDSAGTISGFMPIPRLILFEEHLIMCTKEQEESVRQSLADAGCADPTYISNGSGAPDGWVLFQGVRPTAAVAHDDSAGILNILRPIHGIEIVFRGGIRLSHSTWLNAHPPAIFIRGFDAKILEVMVDGNCAYCDEAGKYTADAWDELGHHTVFCGGVTQSYELVDAINEWEFFDAFSYAPDINKERMISICGPAIFPSSGREFIALVPNENACIIGAIPGQIALVSMDEDVRRGEHLAVADFPIVWVLPPNPLSCDKSSSYVNMINCEKVVKNIGLGNRKFNQNILRWCQAILNASRKQLNVEPSTGEAKQLWDSYKKTARRYWRCLR